MGTIEELERFLLCADDFIDSKYVLADIKVTNLLKTVAESETLITLFKNCLTGFDFDVAKKKYLVKGHYISEDKGEFVPPQSSREFLAFVFNFLVECDNKNIDLGSFIKKYFCEGCTFSLGYQAFLNSMIKPVRNIMKVLMDNIIEGNLQDPIEALQQEEQKETIEIANREKRQRIEKELSQQSYGRSLKMLRDMLVRDKRKVDNSISNEERKDELRLIIDVFGNVIESQDKDAIMYAFTAYKFAVRSNKFIFWHRERKAEKLVRDLINGI